MDGTTMVRRPRAGAVRRWGGTARAWVRGARGAARAVARRAGAGGPGGHGRDAGLATAEYAIVLIAAVGFAGLLVVILSSGEVREALMSLVRGALTV